MALDKSAVEFQVRCRKLNAAMLLRHAAVVAPLYDRPAWPVIYIFMISLRFCTQFPGSRQGLCLTAPRLIRPYARWRTECLG
jgi:hypothetical protein